jgi:general secretion pathway protein A
MYLEYWGFYRPPFENLPDPAFFFLSRGHEEALSRMLYVTRMGKGGALLSGEIGCGKTTLTKVLVQKLSGDRFDIGVLVNPKLAPLEFLQEILYQFCGLKPPDGKGECVRALNERLIENAKQDKHTVLIIDEAQLLSEDNLEELRLLQNFQLNDHHLLTVILVGQPDLMTKIKHMEQIDQRIAIRYHLEPFDLNETVDYIGFRQQKAGREENAFSHEGMERIFDHSQGVPRRINHLCDLALLMGYSQKEKAISPEIIDGVVNDGALC